MAHFYRRMACSLLTIVLCYVIFPIFVMNMLNFIGNYRVSYTKRRTPVSEFECRTPGSYIRSPVRTSKKGEIGKKHKEEQSQLESWPVNGNCTDISNQYPLVANFKDWKGIQRQVARLEPIHTHSFDYLYNCHRLCKSSREIDILSVVKSRVTNGQLRSVIRATWGKKASAGRNRLVFLLGYSQKQSILKSVDNEFKKYGDLVQEDFTDNYYNNSLKTVMSIRWISKFCANSKFVLFIDDDVMVNFNMVGKFFSHLKKSEVNSLYSGNLKKDVRPMKRGRWPMSDVEYPYPCYPPFISGGAILTSGNVVKLFSTIMPFVKLFKYDDVYIAILAQKLGITAKSNKLVKMARTDVSLTNLISKHGYSKPELYLQVYKNLSRTL